MEGMSRAIWVEGATGESASASGVSSGTLGRMAFLCELARPMFGRFVELLPMDADPPVGDLYRESHGDAGRESIWKYLSYGPFEDEQAMRFWLRASADSLDPIFFAIERGVDRRVQFSEYLRRAPAAGDRAYLDRAQASADRGADGDGVADALAGVR